MKNLFSKLFIACIGLVFILPLSADESKDRLLLIPIPGPSCGPEGASYKNLIPDRYCIPAGDCAEVWKACNKHDACYDTGIISKAYCDEQLKENMKNECDSAFNSVFEQAYGVTCKNGLSQLYEIAVSKFGSKAFNNNAYDHGKPRIPAGVFKTESDPNTVYFSNGWHYCGYNTYELYIKLRPNKIITIYRGGLDWYDAIYDGICKGN